MTKISIIIKAYNEERHIAAAINSALKALGGLDGEVVLADGGSVDRTVQIASQYPIRIVQLKNVNERSCGIGPQMGYENSEGEILYLMDGDMVLKYEFIRKALSFLNSNPNVAGVGGYIKEMLQKNFEFQNRSMNLKKITPFGEVDRLNGGGLYRRSAIRDVHYLTDRNLHGYEELDLAARLRSRGWTLFRLNDVAAQHYGHTMNSYRLLRYRLKLGYAYATGEVLRAALGKIHFVYIIKDLRELRLWSFLLGYWMVFAVLLAVLPDRLLFASIFSLGIMIAIVTMSLRRRSLSNGFYCVASWHVYALGLVVGLFKRRKPLSEPIAVRVLKSTTS